MSDERTVPHAAPRGLPVRSVAVEVVDGPAAGTRFDGTRETVAIGSARDNDVVLTDPTVSRYHLALERRDDGVRVNDLGSTNGTAVGPVRIENAVVPIGTVLRLGRVGVRLVEGGTQTVALLGGEGIAGLRGRSAAMRRLMADVERAARAEASVLVVGESGTGKELIARALHDLGPRARAPFVTVDCGALSPMLIGSELFGHERGAFTGADRQHAGAFERAHRGTLFLDEVGELPPAQQAALLGVLERRRFRRLGGTTDLTVDVRVVSATHRDLRGAVNTGAFRLDLYYRLAVVTLTVPPLRSRREDIPLLVEHFLRESGHLGPPEEIVSPAATEALSAHVWPGNVRELRNLVEAALAMGAPLTTPETPSSSPADGADVTARVVEKTWREARGAVLADFELRYLTRLLERSEGNVARAAREAQMDRSHLIDLLHRYGLR